MKILCSDDLEVGQFVTILSGPYKTHWVPPQMRGEEPNPKEDQCTLLGHVFELIAYDRPLVMLRPLTGASAQCAAAPTAHQLGPLASIMLSSGPSVDPTQPLMFSTENIKLAKVDPTWVETFLQYFGEKERKPRTALGVAKTGVAHTVSKLGGFKQKEER